MMGLKVLFLWVPVHIGVKGNEMADKVAKEVTKSNHNDLIVSISRAEVKSIIKKRSKKREGGNGFTGKMKEKNDI